MKARLTIMAFASLLSIATGCAEQADEGDETIDSVDGKADGASTLPKLGVLFDRIGRPEMTNITLVAPDVKPLYNGEDPFALSAKRATYEAVLTAQLKRYDTFDQHIDMTDTQVAHHVAVLVEDTLRVDLSKPCNDIDGDNYLAIERGEYLNQPWTSCGGRTPNEDVIEDVLTLVTGGLGATTHFDDGIGTWDMRTAQQKQVFPYLAEPF